MESGLGGLAFSLLAASLYGVTVCLFVVVLCLAGVQVACHKFSQHKFAHRLSLGLVRLRVRVLRGRWQHAAAVNAIGLIDGICQVIKGIVRISQRYYYLIVIQSGSWKRQAQRSGNYYECNFGNKATDEPPKATEDPLSR